MSKPQQSPFLGLFYHCFTSLSSSLVFFSFLTFSLLFLPMILLSQLISATNSLFSSSFLRHQHSEPYSNTVVGAVTDSRQLLDSKVLSSLVVAYSRVRHTRVGRTLEYSTPG